MERLLFCLLLCIAPLASAQTCTTTLGVGGDIATAVGNAANGATICLNDGTYGTVDIFDKSRSGFVTVRSTNPYGALITPRLGNTDWVRLRNLTLTGLLQNSCSSHIEYVNNIFTGYATVTNDACGNLFTIFDGNTFTAFDKVEGTYDGRLALIYASGITVRNNQFGPGGQNDGIFMGGSVSNVTIGPGNLFTGIMESLCAGLHCDAIQGFGAGTGIVIEGNYFVDGDTYIMMPDGSSGVTVRNNIFDGSFSVYPDKIQFGAAANPVFQHNTLYNIRASFDSKGSPPTTNALVENNIMDGGSSFKTSGGDGCSACTFRFNLFDVSGNASGTNNVIGTPDYAGTTPPGTWQTWKLDTGSPGKAAGNDSKDMGSLFFRPAAPANIR